MQDNCGVKLYKCPDCYKSFTTNKRLLTHQPVCKQLLHPHQCPKCKKVLASFSSKSHHVTNCQAVQQELVNANTGFVCINNFSQETMDHITSDFLTSCIISCRENTNVARLLQAIHCDQDIPQNQNIRIDSIKSKTWVIRQNNMWVIKDAEDVVRMLVEKHGPTLLLHYNNSDELKELDREFGGKLMLNLSRMHHPRHLYATKRVFSAALKNLPRVNQQKR